MPERSSGTESSHLNMERGGGRTRTRGGVIVFLYVIFVDVFLRNKWEKMEEERKRLTSTCPLSAVRLGAAGFFLSPSPIRDHKAYHDGSVCIYQHNTEEKTQTRLRVRQSNPLKLRGASDCEDTTVFKQGGLSVIDQPGTFWALISKNLHIKSRVHAHSRLRASWALCFFSPIQCASLFLALFSSPPAPDGNICRFCEWGNLLLIQLLEKRNMMSRCGGQSDDRTCQTPPWYSSCCVLGWRESTPLRNPRGNLC